MSRWVFFMDSLGNCRDFGRVLVMTICGWSRENACLDWGAVPVFVLYLLSLVVTDTETGALDIIISRNSIICWINVKR